MMTVLSPHASRLRDEPKQTTLYDKCSCQNNKISQTLKLHGSSPGLSLTNTAAPFMEVYRKRAGNHFIPDVLNRSQRYCKG